MGRGVGCGEAWGGAPTSPAAGPHALASSARSPPRERQLIKVVIGGDGLAQSLVILLLHRKLVHGCSTEGGRAGGVRGEDGRRRDGRARLRRIGRRRRPHPPTPRTHPSLPLRSSGSGQGSAWFKASGRRALTLVHRQQVVLLHPQQVVLYQRQLLRAAHDVNHPRVVHPRLHHLRGRGGGGVRAHAMSDPPAWVWVWGVHPRITSSAVGGASPSSPRAHRLPPPLPPPPHTP